MIRSGALVILPEVPRVPSEQTFAAEIEPIRFSISDDRVADSLSINLVCGDALNRALIGKLGATFTVDMQFGLEFFGQLTGLSVSGQTKTQMTLRA